MHLLVWDGGGGGGGGDDAFRGNTGHRCIYRYNYRYRHRRRQVGRRGSRSQWKGEKHGKQTFKTDVDKCPRSDPLFSLLLIEFSRSGSVEQPAHTISPLSPVTQESSGSRIFLSLGSQRQSITKLRDGGSGSRATIMSSGPASGFRVLPAMSPCLSVPSLAPRLSFFDPVQARHQNETRRVQMEQ